MSEAVTNFFRPEIHSDPQAASLAAAQASDVAEIRDRIRKLGEKNGALGAVGQHTLRQLEHGTRSLDSLLND